MKTLIRSVVVAGTLFLAPGWALAQSGDREAVNAVMQKMMRGFEAGDPKLIFEILRKDGVVVGYSTARGAVVTQTAEEWASGFPGKPADDEALRKRSYEILEVTESAAMVRVMLDYPRWEGLDYLALSKIDGKWMIVSKSWSGRSKP